MTEGDGSGRRVALVTGGARGIGLAIARRLLHDGLSVLVVDVNRRELEALGPVEEQFPGAFDHRAASVTDRAEMQDAVAYAVERWGGLDVLVNNAGLNRPGGMFDLTDEGWEAVIAVNLKGTWLCGLAAVPAMRERGGGAIVSLGSVAGAGVGAGSPAYAASKAGLVGLTKSMATELGPDSIRVNLVAPGVTLTGWVQRNLPKEVIAETEQRLPLRRAGTPEDVAAAVAFLASEDARHITGQVLSVSGGEWMP